MRTSHLLLSRGQEAEHRIHAEQHLEPDKHLRGEAEVEMHARARRVVVHLRDASPFEGMKEVGCRNRWRAGTRTMETTLSAMSMRRT